jgi:hypothetical protein
LYQTTHRFFLSERAIYLLVFNLVNQEVSKIEYWLHSLATRVKNCPIVLVGTHLDDERCTKEYVTQVFEKLHNKYAKMFPNIVDYTAVSTSALANFKGVKELQSKIVTVATRYKFIGQRVPSSIVLLSKRIETIMEEQKKAFKPAIMVTPISKACC